MEHEHVWWPTDDSGLCKSVRVEYDIYIYIFHYKITKFCKKNGVLHRNL